MAEKIWNKFVKDIKGLSPNIDNTVMNKLKSNFFDMPSDYFSSRKCSGVIAETLKNINENKLKVYIHLLEFKKAMKSTKKLKRQNSKVISVVETKKIKIVQEIPKNLTNIELEPEIHSTKEYKTNLESLKPLNDNNTSIDSTQTNLNEDNSSNINNEKIERYITKLEFVLQATKEQIEKFEEQELTLDDLDNENSSFILLDKLKSHYVKVWKRISKLRETNSSLHKQYLKLFNFNGSNYPDLNEEINNFVKSKKFPDYHDIKGIVSSYNLKNSLKLSTQKVNELAIDIFTQIGNQLKKLRINEFVQNFGNHLTDQVKNENDPIIHDDQLRKVLHKNYIQGELNLDSVMKNFVTIAETRQNNVESGTDISTEHSSDSEGVNEESVEITPKAHKATVSGTPINPPIIDMRDRNSEQIAMNTEITNSSESKSTSEDVSEISNNLSLVPVEIAPNIIHKQLIIDSNAQKSIEKPSEEYINEISSTTFRFNVEQMKLGDKSQYYKETIILNSDDSNESNGSESDEEEDKSNRYTYSSKLDDFILINPKPKKPEIKEIIINLDDYEDDEDIVLMDSPIVLNQKVNESLNLDKNH